MTYKSKPDCKCQHDKDCAFHEDIAELVPDLAHATIRVINRALNRQRVNFEKAMDELEYKIVNESLISEVEFRILRRLKQAGIVR
jgi:uncharacterized protein with PhoU and TrkA domain